MLLLAYFLKLSPFLSQTQYIYKYKLVLFVLLHHADNTKIILINLFIVEN